MYRCLHHISHITSHWDLILQCVMHVLSNRLLTGVEEIASTLSGKDLQVATRTRIHTIHPALVLSFVDRDEAQFTVRLTDAPLWQLIIHTHTE